MMKSRESTNSVALRGEISRSYDSFAALYTRSSRGPLGHHAPGKRTIRRRGYLDSLPAKRCASAHPAGDELSPDPFFADYKSSVIRVFMLMASGGAVDWRQWLPAEIAAESTGPTLESSICFIPINAVNF